MKTGHTLLCEENDLTTEEEIKQVDEGSWVYEFDKEINKMKRYIPNLGIHDYEAVPVNISVKEEELLVSFSTKAKIKRYESSTISDSYLVAV